jgi:AmpD protein
MTRAPATPEAGDALWQAGWYRFAHRVDSPNFGPRPPGVYGGDEVRRLFTNTLDWDAHPYFQQIRGMQVSAHFFIRRDGALLQFVSCDARAWHAGNSQYRGRANCNDDSVGIELEGLEGERFEPAQYEALAAVCAAIAQHYPIAHVAGHEHIAPARKQDPGPGFDWALLQRELGWPAEWFPQG